MAPPAKRRKKSVPAIAEITFDSSAREEYLTGFHKRKVQRIKHAQEEAARKERQERVIERKRMRDERKADLERHVETVNALLREANGTVPGVEEVHSGSDTEGWNGVTEPEAVDHEAEYIDEDRYTTVTVEAINVSKEGIDKVMDAEETDDPDPRGEDKQIVTDGGAAEEGNKVQNGKRRWTKENPDGHVKKKKKKFKYESKAERKVTRYKERSGNKSKARARKE